MIHWKWTWHVFSRIEDTRQRIEPIQGSEDPSIMIQLSLKLGIIFIIIGVKRVFNVVDFKMERDSEICNLQSAC